MANDRVSELYYGQIMRSETQEACQHRINWMCSQVPTGRVLDFGCSQGIASIILGREGHRVVGVDIDHESIAYAQADLAKQPEDTQSNVTFRAVTVEPLPFDEASFDSILLGEVLEHQTQPGRLIAEAHRLLRPGGRLIITLPFGVHPHPEHFQTFYLSQVLCLLERDFQIGHLSVADKYIYCHAVKAANSTPDDQDVKNPTRLLTVSEQAFEWAENRYFDRQREQQVRIEQLVRDRDQRQSEWTALECSFRDDRSEIRKQARSIAAFGHSVAAEAADDASCAKLSDALHRFDQLWDRLEAAQTTSVKLGAMRKVSDAMRELTALLQRILTDEQPSVRARHKKEMEAQRAEAERSIRQLETRLNHLSEQLKYYKRECARRFEEVRYRLGDALVKASSNPIDLLRLPWNLARLLVAGLRRKRERQVKTVPASPATSSSKTSKAATTKTPKIEFRPADATDIQAKAAMGITPIVHPHRTPRLPVKAAVIMDEFTHECFRDECHLIQIKPDDWRQVLSAERPDFLFVESAWKGNDMAWRHMIQKAREMPDGQLLPLVAWCKENNIPTVFWNKEDPPNFEHFVFAATQFDYIFTTDEECIERYREHVGHDRVYALPFAAQPTIHHPIGSKQRRPGRICFGGTYYAKRHPERRADIEMLLEPALARGLHIYDRMRNFTLNENYKFPDVYRPAIRCGLSYPEMVDAYKKYDIFLNVNSVKHSPTMFARRVFELLASGTAVISNFSLAIEQLLGSENVALIHSKAEAAQWMDDLINKPEIAERMVHRGQRRVFTEHTYEHRLRFILDKIGIDAPAISRRVSVIGCVAEPGQLDHIIASYERQAYEQKELVLVVKGDGLDLGKVQQRLASVPNAGAIQAGDPPSVGVCLNQAVERSRFEYVSWFSTDAFYGEYFLTDLMSAFTYTDAALVGKCAHYEYIEEQNDLTLKSPDAEHCFVDALSNSATIIKRDVFEQVHFPDGNMADDTQFHKDCASKGFKMYAADRFNHVVHRGKPTGGSPAVNFDFSLVIV